LLAVLFRWRESSLFSFGRELLRSLVKETDGWMDGWML